MKTLMKLFALFAFIAAPAYAADSQYAKDGVANNGYDVVAYFSLDAGADAVKGNSDYSANHDGYTYHFANTANRDAFTADPGAYLPQYGGYCAFAVAKSEKKVKVDPNAWAIIDGKLYLNYSKSVQIRWLEDTSGNISTANTVWGKIKDSKFKSGWF